MITASELRIGNRIVNSKGTEFTVIAEDFVEIQTFPQNYSGITLNEDRLLDAGFKRNDNYFYSIPVGGSELYINPNNGVVWIERGDNIFNNPACIDYVHQLQNLYFALTLNELPS